MDLKSTADMRVITAYNRVRNATNTASVALPSNIGAAMAELVMAVNELGEWLEVASGLRKSQEAARPKGQHNARQTGRTDCTGCKHGELFADSDLSAPACNGCKDHGHHSERPKG
jgi:hypothetical protein